MADTNPQAQNESRDSYAAPRIERRTAIEEPLLGAATSGLTML
jgi:hypothetical protein